MRALRPGAGGGTRRSSREVAEAGAENVTRGMLCVVKADTGQVIAARRMATLGALGTRSSDLTETETIASACEHLASNPWSLPTGA